MKTCIVAGIATLVLLLPLGRANAGWGIEFDTLTSDGTPDIVKNEGATAAASLDVSIVSSPGISTISHNSSTSANATPGFPYKTSTGSAWIVSEFDFTWNGGGTPTNLQLKKRLTWSVTAGAPGLIGPYCKVWFDLNEPATSSSSSPAWENGFLITSSTTHHEFSTWTYSTSGYSGGGYSSRAATAEYAWDVSNWY